MSKILDGKKLSDRLALKLIKKVKKLTVKPKLAILQIGNLAESNTYIKNKKAFAEKIGVLVEHKKYPNNVVESELISDILKYNSDSAIHGIMLQLPIPKRLHTNKVLDLIDPRKDVDGLTSTNTRLLFDGEQAFIPASARGIITLLEYYNIGLIGTRVTIVGDSPLVGRSIALALLNKGATVVICHKHTRNLAKETKRAEILVAAVGHPKLITTRHVSKNQVVIDVGINIIGKKKIMGDVDYEKVQKMVKAITPVPGGVGPMTVTSLFQNLLESYSLQS